MINSENHITLKNINYSVNNKYFFKNLSTDISTNGITVILGPNGSGKTLLTKIIKGLIKPESGKLSIKLNGMTPITGYLSQNIIFLRRNVFNNLAYPLEIKGFNKKMIKKRVEFLLKYFGFSSKEKISARNLSEGNKQYLSFIIIFEICLKISQSERFILWIGENLDKSFRLFIMFIIGLNCTYFYTRLTLQIIESY